MKQKKAAVIAALRETTYIGIYIDTIDDIFSDFDPRKIEVRNISQDFINEMHHQAKQSKKTAKMEVNIFAPRLIKRTELTPRVEKIIRRRIRQYFMDEHHRLRSERRKQIIRAMIFLVSGLTCFFIVKLAGNPQDKELAVKLFLELITFFSWFATWNGIDIFADLPKRSVVLVFNRLADAQIQFRFVKDFSVISTE